jgi:hypothetical protein
MRDNSKTAAIVFYIKNSRTKSGSIWITSHFKQAPQPYSFEYDVQDKESYNDFLHSEKSDYNVVTGSYRVALPDGRTQIVTYKADKDGYNADVKYEGEAQYPEEPKYKPAASYPAPAYAAPAYPAPSYSAPAYKAPEYKAPAPAYKAPTYSAPAYKAPVYTAPAYKAPAYVAPTYSAPSYKEPEYTAPAKYAAPIYRAPSYPAAPTYKAPVAAYPKY